MTSRTPNTPTPPPAMLAKVSKIYRGLPGWLVKTVTFLSTLAALGFSSVYIISVVFPDLLGGEAVVPQVTSVRPEVASPGQQIDITGNALDQVVEAQLAKGVFNRTVFMLPAGETRMTVTIPEDFPAGDHILQFKTKDGKVIATEYGINIVTSIPVVEQPPAVFEAETRDIAFVPADIVVKVGDSIRWTNRDSVPHTATSGTPGAQNAGSLFDGQLSSSSQQFSHVFQAPGTFQFFCRVHPAAMRGTITVQESGASSAATGGDQISSKVAGYAGAYSGGIVESGAVHQFEFTVASDGKVSGSSQWPATGTFTLSGTVLEDGQIDFQDDSPQRLGFRGGVYEGRIDASGSVTGVYYERTREQQRWNWTAVKR